MGKAERLMFADDAPEDSGTVVDLAQTLRERDERERAPGKALRDAHRALQPLLRDLPSAETFLLLPAAADAWRIVRDEDPDAFLCAIATVRQKCGHVVAQLVQQRIGPPRGAGRSGPLFGYAVGAVWDDFQAAAYIAKRILAPDALTVIFGQSGHLKSVTAVDLALSCATGAPFHDVKVSRRVGVLYVAGEGHAGIKKRVRAKLKQMGIGPGDEQPALYITSEAADLIGNPERLRATAEHAAEVLGVPIELVVIDTLAANFGAGDEYHPRDMSLAIASARSAAPGAAVLLVHHTGHGNVERERGSYALIAAADFRLQATYDEPQKLLELKWLKCKDDEIPPPLTFECRKVGLDVLDEDGEELTSVVIERLEGASVQQGPRTVGLGKHQETALRTLRTLYARARRNLEEADQDAAQALILTDGWRNALVPKKLPRQRFHDVITDLQERRLIAIDGPHVRLLEVMP